MSIPSHSWTPFRLSCGETTALLSMATSTAFSLTEGNNSHLVRFQIGLSYICSGLKAKLYSSSLPLEARCRLATNVITCRVAVPHRLTELILEMAKIKCKHVQGEILLSFS